MFGILIFFRPGNFIYFNYALILIQRMQFMSLNIQVLF